MIEVKHAREISGEISLPVDPELFYISAVTAYAAGSEISIKDVRNTPLIEEYKNELSQLMTINNENTAFYLKPMENIGQNSVALRPDITPLIDFVIPFFLARGKTVTLDNALNLDFFRKVINKTGCVTETEKDGKSISITDNKNFNVNDIDISYENLNICIGLCLGLKKKFSLKSGISFQTPLREILPRFGYEFTVKSDFTNTKNDPLTRRLELMRKRKRKPSKTTYTITADFSLKTNKTVSINLPGDSLLTAIILLAKSLVQKGDLMLQNTPLEAWNSSFLTQIRKMGCKPGIQETGETSYGKLGMIKLQRFKPAVRKTDCKKYSGFPSSLPPILLLSCFTKGKSIFRNLKNVYHSDTSMIDNILHCIELTGGRYGEMDDGIIVESPDYHDGFDLKLDFGAAINGTCTALAFASSGSSIIEDRSILMRWPDFISYFSNIEKILT